MTQPLVPSAQSLSLSSPVADAAHQERSLVAFSEHGAELARAMEALGEGSGSPRTDQALRDLSGLTTSLQHQLEPGTKLIQKMKELADHHEAEAAEKDRAAGPIVDAGLASVKEILLPLLGEAEWAIIEKLAHGPGELLAVADNLEKRRDQAEFAGELFRSLPPQEGSAGCAQAEELLATFRMAGPLSEARQRVLTVHHEKLARVRGITTSLKQTSESLHAEQERVQSWVLAHKNSLISAYHALESILQQAGVDIPKPSKPWSWGAPLPNGRPGGFTEALTNPNSTPTNPNPSRPWGDALRLGTDELKIEPPQKSDTPRGAEATGLGSPVSSVVEEGARPKDSGQWLRLGEAEWTLIAPLPELALPSTALGLGPASGGGSGASTPGWRMQDMKGLQSWRGSPAGTDLPTAVPLTPSLLIGADAGHAEGKSPTGASGPLATDRHVGNGGLKRSSPGADDRQLALDMVPKRRKRSTSSAESAEANLKGAIVAALGALSSGEMVLDDPDSKAMVLKVSPRRRSSGKGEGRTSRGCMFEGCPKNPTFGFKGCQPVSCKAHSEPGMEDVRSKRCQAEGCKTQAHYGFKGKGCVACKEHSEPGMINIHKKRCKVEGCDKHPSFGYPGEKSTHCKAHMEPGMVDVVNKRCHAEGCTKRPSFGMLKNKPTHCREHREPDMVFVLKAS